ncbi:3909_t:CDS:2, partial [Cetraspora pellucida]
MAEARCLSLWAYLKKHMTVLKNANAKDFNDAVKYNILKSIMGRKYASVLANNGLVTVRNQQLAIQRLIQEKYQSYNTLDTYEARVQPLLLEVANNDIQVIGFLKSHLTTPASQTVELVKQPKGLLLSLQLEKDFQNYYISKFLNKIGLITNNKLDSDYSIKPFQRPHSQQKQSMKINRIESKANKLSDFAIKGNSRHITNLLEWYTDVLVTMKDKK